ncbi:hypothetical protein LWI28_006180 [Acer negundo]|uniref:Uncharacterized protein n=1 Tax=Acer negundo TaxID=4023 RepID=A0AAD5P0U5_ACENE|nr:hypothetical protein LWI28_006180 [Acer negundo]
MQDLWLVLRVVNLLHLFAVAFMFDRFAVLNNKDETAGTVYRSGCQLIWCWSYAAYVEPRMEQKSGHFQGQLEAFTPEREHPYATPKTERQWRWERDGQKCPIQSLLKCSMKVKGLMHQDHIFRVRGQIQN